MDLSESRPDFAEQIRARLPAFRTLVGDRDAIVESVRHSNATLDPRHVATWLVQQANKWFPAPCWAVISHDINGAPAVLADLGLTPGFAPSLWSAAHWVMSHGTEFFAADLASDTRAVDGGSGSAIAFPLLCRSRTIGVLVGLDGAPSTSTPSLGATLGLMRALLEPPAGSIENALALQKAEALSVTDDLTRLYNSRYLNLSLRRETKRSSRTGRPLSLLFIDLDGFKQVNDQYGHLTGGKALVEAAVLIRGSARETDIVARFGGDEFSVVLPDTDGEGAVLVATRLLERFRAFRFLTADGCSVSLTASIGVATLPDVAASADDLLRAADVAMYRAKAAGKDGFRIAQEALPPSEGSV